MFEHYNSDYISQRMSLRTPQAESLKILDRVLSKVDVKENTHDIQQALSAVREMHPTCTDFGRDFMSLAFVLATGVGKTRLMGAFIAYLYTVRGLKNFFVVAPNTVIYEKLRNDLGNPTSDKYVFKGLDCFAVNPPRIITGEDYRNKQLTISGIYSDVNIYIYNISKFDKDQTKMRAVNEWLGESFVDALADVKDLVLLMDESHHYHADKGAQALNDLKPVLGLELTATPYYNEKSKQKKFTNAVYEYPLSQSIKDGYTRTPYALTRSDFKTYGFDEDTQDKVMLRDAIVAHRRTKALLENYSQNTGRHLVKPFVLVVCKDTSHADEVYNYINSDDFFDGFYANKTIVIHSAQRGAESDKNVELLQSVESPDNPIEIVVHVNKLKEGWDVNNLYTIVPLRTAASKILREQMVGRGLRLPYGERTGIKDIDMVVLTAHDNFAELLKEAQSGDSIFNKDKVLYADQTEPLVIEQQVVNQPKLDFEDNIISVGDLNLSTEEQKTIYETISTAVSEDCKPHTTKHVSSEEVNKRCIEALLEKASGDKDKQEQYDKNLGPLFEYAHQKLHEIKEQTKAKFIPIPRIRIVDSGITNYIFLDFDLDLSAFHHTPTDQSLTLANLQNQADVFLIKGQGLSLQDNPRSRIISKLRQKPELDYQKDGELLQKLVGQLLAFFEYEYGKDGMENIVFMNTNDLTDRIYKQLMLKEHVEKQQGLFVEEVVGYQNTNYSTSLAGIETHDLFHTPSSASDVPRCIFNNIQKGVFNTAKFDSLPELIFARVVERDDKVLNWLRPADDQFEIYYEGGRRYEPDFVVETEDTIFLVEVKGENQFNDPSVALKARRGIQYCSAATSYALANGGKPWEYLFLPSKCIHAESTFGMLVNQNYATEIIKKLEL